MNRAFGTHSWAVLPHPPQNEGLLRATRQFLSICQNLFVEFKDRIPGIGVFEQNIPAGNLAVNDAHPANTQPIDSFMLYVSIMRLVYTKNRRCASKKPRFSHSRSKCRRSNSGSLNIGQEEIITDESRQITVLTQPIFSPMRCR
ncbi:MAG: hypothetical protein WCP35_04245 [Verrucomicrobiota bacterium]